MKKFEVKIVEEEPTGITKIFLTDKPMCGVMGIAFSDTIVNSEIKDGIKVVSYDLSSEIKSNKNKKPPLI